MRTKRDPEERFWEKVRRTPDTCWEWTGSTTQRTPTYSYGQFNLNGRAERTSRVSWMFTNGPIPKGMNVCHSCDNPTCVRPSHLFLGTQYENMQDMMRKGRRHKQTPISRCKHGHDMNGDNLLVKMVKGKPRRHCRACEAVFSRAIRERNLAPVLGRERSGLGGGRCLHAHEVRRIREECHDWHDARRLGKELGVSYDVIWRIYKGQTYRDVA